MRKADHIKVVQDLNQKCIAAALEAGEVFTGHHNLDRAYTIAQLKELTIKLQETILALNTKAAAQKTNQPSQGENNMAKPKTPVEICTPIIVTGFKNKATKDQIISDCFDAGVRSIAELMKLYTQITVAEGLVVDPAKATELITAEVEQSDWTSVTSYAQIELIVEEIKVAVPGATDQRVKALITSYCKEQGIDLPKKTAAVKGGIKSVGGKVVEVMVDAFLNNSKASKFDCLLAVGPTIQANVKDKEAAAKSKVTKYYTALYAVANGMTMIAALEETGSQTFEAPVEE